jgi:glycosyltransferase involved in cell wall biosynthesis
MKISVIVPVYNIENYLDECIQSVKNSAMNIKDAIEVLIIDDASSDKSASIAKKWADDWSSVRVFTHAENKGVSAARNTGLAASSGDWILWLDGDNALHPDGIERILKKSREYPSTDIWILQMHLMNSQSVIIGSFYGDHINVNPCDILRVDPYRLLVANFIDNFSFVKKSIAEAEPYDETLRTLEDWDMWIRQILSRKVNIDIVTQEIGLYRKRIGQSTSHHNPKNKEFLSANIQIYAKALLRLSAQDIPAHIMNMLFAQIKFYADEFIGLYTDGVASNDKSSNAEKTVDPSAVRQRLFQAAYKSAISKLE